MKKWVLIFFICIFCTISFVGNSPAKDTEVKVSIFLQVNRSLNHALFPILRLHIAENYNLNEPEYIDFYNLCKEVQELTISFCKKTRIPLLKNPTVQIFAFNNEHVSGFRNEPNILRSRLKFRKCNI